MLDVNFFVLNKKGTAVDICNSIVLSDISKIFHNIFLPETFKGNEVLFYFHFYLNQTKFTCTNNNFKNLRVLASIICPKDNDKF